jgi:lipoprotein-releasing system permease protein
MNGIRFEWMLALRFLTENKGQTLIIALGIAIGVAVMVFLTALIDGLQANLIQNTVGRSPHIVISNDENASAHALKIFD